MFTMRLGVAGAVVAVALAASGGAGNAATLSLSVDDILGFAMLDSESPGSTFTFNNGIVPDGHAVTITTIFAPPQTGPQYADVGLQGLSIAYDAGDLFGLHITNTNENPWTYQLSVMTDQGLFQSFQASLIPDTGMTFLASLGGAAGFISEIYFTISANVPFPDGDRTAEYEIAPATAPIPPAVALFGSGLIGLGLLSRKRRRKQKQPLYD
jgi:hypothetical protein